MSHYPETGHFNPPINIVECLTIKEDSKDIYIYNIIEHVYVCLFVCVFVHPFEKINDTGVASVEPGRARE